MKYIKKSSGRFFLAAASVAALLAVSGCSMEYDTNIPQKRVRLESGPAYKTMPAAAVDEATLHDFAAEYLRFGDGPVELTVSYDPRSKTNTAMNASDHAARIGSRLRTLNVPQVSSSILPVNALGEEAHVMMRYESTTAHAPEGCDYMGGLEGKATGAYMDYEYGCTTEMLLARQIARPKDLAGRDGMSAGDGRRQALTVDGYRRGQTPPTLSGYSITE
jgi:type IV pilus biogenesis protein CpaD/CtpE